MKTESESETAVSGRVSGGEYHNYLDRPKLTTLLIVPISSFRKTKIVSSNIRFHTTQSLDAQGHSSTRSRCIDEGLAWLPDFGG